MEKKQFSEKIFLFDSYKFSELDCTLIQIKDDKNPDYLLLEFDKTIFHPQGGGQPSDIGEISDKNTQYQVIDVIYDREIDRIYLKIQKIDDWNNIFILGKQFNQIINEEKRRINAKLHSAGHLIDCAVKNIKLDFIPGKGYHFNDSPYVEYIGKIPEDIEKIKVLLTNECNNIIKQNSLENKVEAKIFEYEEAKKYFEIPEYLDKNKPIRFVKLFDKDLGCPCGGTHVKNILDIGEIIVTKIAKKGKNVRVSYQIK